MNSPLSTQTILTLSNYCRRRFLVLIFYSCNVISNIQSYASVLVSSLFSSNTKPREEVVIRVSVVEW